MIPFYVANYLNATSAIQNGLDRSLSGMDATANADGFKFALADPTTGACSLAPTSGTVPEAGSACTTQGAVAWNMQKWFDDSADWVLYCNTDNLWDNVATAKKKTTWELAPDAGKKWVRIDVDTSNKPANTPDNPTSWLKGEATGLTTINPKCDDAEPSGWGQGGSLFICIHGMTNQEEFIGMICSRGVSNDTPDCGGHVGLNEAQITTTSTDCTVKT